MASRPRIRVINPNSNEAVTRGIDDAVASLRFADGPKSCARRWPRGHSGSRRSKHVESVALPLRKLVESDTPAMPS